MKNSYSEYVAIFKALSDETRLRIIKMIAEGELCACHILEAFNISQPTLSYHMKILTECGLVKGKKEGAWMKYTINQKKVTKIKDFYESIQEV